MRFGGVSASPEYSLSTAEQATKGPRTVSLADEEGVKQVLVGAAIGLWEVVNNLTRLRPSRQER